MKICISRYYHKERLKLECEVITPMFLGNAHQETELRTAAFKGFLRYWWRVMCGFDYSPMDLFATESHIFGVAGDDSHGSGKSLISLKMEPIRSMKPCKNALNEQAKVEHPESKKTNYKVGPLGYLAGMGLIHYKKGLQHSYFPPDDQFRLILDYPGKVADDIHATIAAWQRFGAIGSRNRNGYGCFAIINMADIPEVPISLHDFDSAFERDYPHCLGKSQKGPLLWQLETSQATWERCMRDLANVYIKVRTSLPFHEGEPHEAPQDRHILGYPVTNHCVNKTHWGKINKKGKCSPTRHASALRLIVRKEADGYRGYFLHLPHRFSERMWPDDVERQKRIWRKVHEKLDELGLSRVRPEEVPV